MEHTPTPWKKSENNWGKVNIHNFPNGGGTNLIADLIGNAKEMDSNADFIVRAVNSHDELVEACKEVLLWAKTPGNHGGNPYCMEFVKKAEKALAKAEGKN